MQSTKQPDNRQPTTDNQQNNPQNTISSPTPEDFPSSLTPETHKYHTNAHVPCRDQTHIPC